MSERLYHFAFSLLSWTSTSFSNPGIVGATVAPATRTEREALAEVTGWLTSDKDSLDQVRARECWRRSNWRMRTLLAHSVADAVSRRVGDFSPQLEQLIAI